MPRFRFKAHAFQSRPGNLVLVRMKCAQVDDGPDAHHLQLFHTFRRRLGAAIKIGRDLVTVFNTGHPDFLRPARRAGSGVGFAGQTKSSGGKQNRN